MSNFFKYNICYFFLSLSLCKASPGSPLCFTLACKAILQNLFSNCLYFFVYFIFLRGPRRSRHRRTALLIAKQGSPLCRSTVVPATRDECSRTTCLGWTWSTPGSKKRLQVCTSIITEQFEFCWLDGYKKIRSKVCIEPAPIIRNFVHLISLFPLRVSAPRPRQFSLHAWIGGISPLLSFASSPLGGLVSLGVANSSGANICL